MSPRRPAADSPAPPSPGACPCRAARRRHYGHSLESSSVKSTTCDPSRGTATMLASLAETVRVTKGEGAPAQTFRSEYSVRYGLRRVGDAWLIAHAEVLA